jgi:hypothetical protein
MRNHHHSASFLIHCADMAVESFERRVAMPSMDAAVDRRAEDTKSPCSRRKPISLRAPRFIAQLKNEARFRFDQVDQMMVTPCRRVWAFESSAIHLNWVSSVSKSRSSVYQVGPRWA